MNVSLQNLGNQVVQVNKIVFEIESAQRQGGGIHQTYHWVATPINNTPMEIATVSVAPGETKNVSGAVDNLTGPRMAYELANDPTREPELTGDKREETYRFLVTFKEPLIVKISVILADHTIVKTVQVV